MPRILTDHMTNTHRQNNDKTVKIRRGRGAPIFWEFVFITLCLVSVVISVVVQMVAK